MLSAVGGLGLPNGARAAWLMVPGLSQDSLCSQPTMGRVALAHPPLLVIERQLCGIGRLCLAMFSESLGFLYLGLAVRYICTMHFAFRDILLQKTLKHSVGDPVAIEAEAVSAWIGLEWVLRLHPIVGSSGIGNARAECLGEHGAFGCYDPALLIDIKLSEWRRLAEWDLLALMVLHLDPIRLIPACPDHEVSRPDMLLLLFRSWGLHQRDPLLLAIDDSFVERLGVASEASIRVEVAILSGEEFLTEVCVAVQACLLDRGVEHSYSVSIQNLDGSLTEAIVE